MYIRGDSMSYEMTLEVYTKFVDSEKRSMIEHNLSAKEKEFLAVSNALGGECGELQNIVKKIISKNKFYDTDYDTESILHYNFLLEAGDVLWYLVRLIQINGFTLEEVMRKNIKKLEAKYATGVDIWRT